MSVSAKIELKQVFANVDAVYNTEARYIFPVPANAAVCAFRMETGDGRVVRGIVKELVKAQNEYKDAVSKGKWAGLLEQVTGDGMYLSMSQSCASSDSWASITSVRCFCRGDTCWSRHQRVCDREYILRL